MTDGLSSSAVAAGEYWSKRKPYSASSVWWGSPSILRHINRIVCGEPIDGAFAGSARLLRQAAGKTLKHGVSVGCGEGGKEMRLLASGIVERFTLFEVAEDRISRGRERAQQMGLSDRVNFVFGDALSADHTRYDLVHWNNALHHMMDTTAAVEWSRSVLEADGWFFMDDFVGATRWQWSDRSLEVANRVRSFLPSRFLENDAPRQLKRPDAARLAAADPSEAADSDNIVPAIRRVFPDARIIHTGGCIYHLALSKLLSKFSAEDEVLLESLLLLDEEMARAGETHYAVTVAQKH